MQLTLQRIYWILYCEEGARSSYMIGALDYPVEQGILLFGFSEEDGRKVDRWFQKMEPGFVVSYASEELMSNKLSDVILGHDGRFRRHTYQSPPSGILGPLVLMSGMCWEEVTGILEFWHQTGGLQLPSLIVNAICSSIKMCNADGKEG
jgi:hypothetical protein